MDWEPSHLCREPSSSGQQWRQHSWSSWASAEAWVTSAGPQPAQKVAALSCRRIWQHPRQGTSWLVLHRREAACGSIIHPDAGDGQSCWTKQSLWTGGGGAFARSRRPSNSSIHILTNELRAHEWRRAQKDWRRRRREMEVMDRWGAER